MRDNKPASSPRLEIPTRGVLRGAWAEDHAAQFLEQAGLHILERNYRIRGGEIDLIALEQEVTVFIEVKQRASSSHGTVGETITARKAGLVRRAALFYLRRDDLPCRFDAVLIEGASRATAKITWLKDAF